MPTNPLSFVLRMGEGAHLRRYYNAVKSINNAEEIYSVMSDDELSAQTAILRKRIEAGEDQGDVLPHAFAVIREASRRVLGKRHFDVQLFGGIVLARGHIAEMKTGEGKSLTAILPAYLHALEGKGVHVVTVNDYLASTQAEQMSRIFALLNMTVGCVTNEMSTSERQAEYAKDITYGTSTEFGFDYLRDNMAARLDGQVQRGHHSIILDEVDSILIDEARTPLIISGKKPLDSNMYDIVHEVALQLEEEKDYKVDKKKQLIVVTEEGLLHAEELLEIDNMYSDEYAFLIALLDNALRAKELFHRDEHYIVAPGETGADEVHLVDPHTGRVLGGRRYSDSLHQALEAKEKVEIQPENSTLATITLQHYVKLYKHLSGMTGTAYSEAAELARTYNVDVIQVPTHRAVQRIDHPDRAFNTKDDKYEALMDEIEKRHKKGQPILIGTATIATSEEVSALLRERKLKHNVLNAKEIDSEADIVAQAGLIGAITVATNMAGRGTDIILGGNAEHYAESHLIELGIDPIEKPLLYDTKMQQFKKEFAEKHKMEYAAVVEAGGLCVLGTERHQSKRIDDQLRGRAGRQGDVGESQFFISADDELLVSRNPEESERLHKLFDKADKTSSKSLHRAEKSLIKSMSDAQMSTEADHENTRRDVEKYDKVVAVQRDIIYKERQKALNMEFSNASRVREFAKEAVHGILVDELHGANPDKWDFEMAELRLQNIYPMTVFFKDIEEYYGLDGLLISEIEREILSDLEYTIDSRVAQLGGPDEFFTKNAEKTALLSALDTCWSAHLDVLSEIQEGIHLRTFAGKTPEMEFQQDAAKLFRDMTQDICETCVRNFFGGAITLEAFAKAIAQGLIVINRPDPMDMSEDVEITWSDNDKVLYDPLQEEIQHAREAVMQEYDLKMKNVSIDSRVQRRNEIKRLEKERRKAMKKAIKEAKSKVMF